MVLDDFGTTSAYAEKSRKTVTPENPPGNYLRIRGEEFLEDDPETVAEELPPHTRRRAKQHHRTRI